MKIIKIVSITIACFILASCQSTQQIENTFNDAYLAQSTDLIFTSPNFSAMHAPPLMSGFAYLESYEIDTFCNEWEPSPIGKITVTRNNKTQFTKLPTGEIVVKVGYHAVGATGGGLKGSSYYSFLSNPEHTYRISVTESRPLVVRYTVAVHQVNPDGSEGALVDVISDRDNICRNRPTTSKPDAVTAIVP